MIVIVMGVTGAGKTTVGALLARRLGWVYADADDFHSPQNVEKMRAGLALDEADRQPWLDALRGQIETWLADGQDAVLACSALKRAYRDELRAGPAVRFVYLEGSYEEIARRLDGRRGHFATRELLWSQFEALEAPAPDEHAVVLPVTLRLEDAVTEAIRALGISMA